MYFLPRNCVDPFSNELDRAIRMGDNRVPPKDAEYIGFKVPLKSTEFQTQLYPDYPALQPTMNFEEYKAG